MWQGNRHLSLISRDTGDNLTINIHKTERMACPEMDEILTVRDRAGNVLK